MATIMRLSAVEQQPRPRTIYTQLCFCYDVPHGHTHEQILGRFRQGLSRLTSFVPWVAGQVVEQEGIFGVAPLDDLPRLVVRDFTTEISMPTMQQFKDAKFPFSMLDEKLICPRNTLSDGPNQDDTHPYPVLLLQANFVQGGILLTILACHSVMDIVGEVQIIKLLSKACHGDAPTNKEIADCNMDRQHIIPLLNDEERGAGKDLIPLRPQVLSATPSSPPQPEPTAPKLRWVYFQFSDHALRTLKTLAISTLPESTPFVSTDDCICALLWQSLARVCLARLSSAEHLHFSRQADVRKYMNVSATYPGNMVASVNTSHSLAELTTEPLGSLASKLRALLIPEVLVYTLRAGAIVPEDRAQETQKASNQEQKQYRDNKRVYRDNTIIMSSWTKADCSNVDFNLGLGKPVAVRRPMFSPYEGIVYLLPRSNDGELLAGWCLWEEDIEGLRNDEEFCKWGEYIG